MGGLPFHLHLSSGITSWASLGDPVQLPLLHINDADSVKGGGGGEGSIPKDETVSPVKPTFTLLLPNFQLQEGQAQPFACFSGWGDTDGEGLGTLLAPEFVVGSHCRPGPQTQWGDAGRTPPRLQLAGSSRQHRERGGK